jgi:hypothetical protein
MIHLPRAGGDSGADAGRPAHLHTGFRALDFHAPGTIGRAGIPGMGSLQGQILRWMFGRLWNNFGLRQCRRNRKYRYKDQKKHISHLALLSRAPTIR